MCLRCVHARPSATMIYRHDDSSSSELPDAAEMLPFAPQPDRKLSAIVFHADLYLFPLCSPVLVLVFLSLPRSSLFLYVCLAFSLISTASSTLLFRFLPSVCSRFNIDSCTWYLLRPRPEPRSFLLPVYGYRQSYGQFPFCNNRDKTV